MSEPPSSSATRASGREWALAALLSVNLTWTTLANGGYGAWIELITLYLTATLVTVYALTEAWPGGPRRPLHPAGWMLLPFLGYALANVLWVTPVPWLGWRDWLGWAQMIAVFWVVLNGIRSRGPRWLLFYTLVGLGLVGVVFGCYQRFVQPEWRPVGPAREVAFLGRASGSFGIPNSFAGFLLLLLPAVIALTLRRAASATARVWWGWVGVVLLFGLVLTLSRGAWLALLVTLSVWPLVGAKGGWRYRSALALGLFCVLTGLGFTIAHHSPKARERFAQLALDSGERTRPIVWLAAWRLFQEAPALGTGAGSYNLMFEKHRPERFRDEPLWAHNEYLNTLSDYGAAGFLLFFGVAGVIAVKFSRQPRSDMRRSSGLAEPFVSAGLGAGLGAFALQMTLDFHLKIPGLAAAFATVSALWVGAIWSTEGKGGEGAAIGRMAGIAVTGGVVVVTGLFFRPMLHAESIRLEARQGIDRLSAVAPTTPAFGQTLALAHAALVRATGRDSANAQAWADLAYATALRAHVEPARSRELGLEAEKWANRALAISAGSAEFHVRRAVALDLQERWEEAGKDFAAATALAPRDATMWFYRAHHLFLRPAAQEEAEAALKTCLRLDPWNSMGLALRQRLAIKTKAP